MSAFTHRMERQESLWERERHRFQGAVSATHQKGAASAQNLHPEKMYESSKCLRTLLAPRPLLCASPHLLGGPEAHGPFQIGVLFSGVWRGRHEPLVRGSGCARTEKPSARNLLGEFVGGRMNFLVCLLIGGKFFKGIYS